MSHISDPLPEGRSKKWLWFTLLWPSLKLKVALRTGHALVVLVPVVRHGARARVVDDRLLARARRSMGHHALVLVGAA